MTSKPKNEIKRNRMIKKTQEAAEFNAANNSPISWTVRKSLAYVNFGPHVSVKEQ